MGGESINAGKLISSFPKLSNHPVGQLISSIYKGRIEGFYNKGQYEGSNLQAMMWEGIASGSPHIELSVWNAPNLTRPTFEEAISQSFRPTSVGESFGPSWSTHWFKVQLTVPEQLVHKRLLELHWDANNEGMVWTEAGNPVQGLTGGGERIEWILPEEFRDNKKHTIYIEMACNGMFGNAPGGDSIQPPNPDNYYKLSKAEIVAVNIEARQLHIDTWIIGDAAREFPTDSWEQHKALKVVNEIIDAFQLGNQESIIKGRKLAQQYLGENINTSAVYETGTKHIVYGIGHCHIDTCWLWPWAETKRKIARSWTNQCNLMDQYPEHRFTVSQAQQYKWLKQNYPYVFNRVKLNIKRGRFQPVGGSWVEHDTNIPSGESLVRQFLYGQRFFESNFGERCRTFWLPDTFGYSSQLPQLCRLAGMNRFFTQKLSWNNINNFPHTTFNWVALDGSQVICHMTPAETYTANAEFGDLKRSISQHKSMDQDETSLLVFGKGDGGGGPTWQHLEKLRRCRGLSDTIGMLPRVHMGKSVEDFFDQLEKKVEDGLEFVTWYGELYFELHRGTYTTQAKNKLNNRKCENMLRSIELLATQASIRFDYRYPKKEIDSMWEATLLCQFHDCLPGSSIEMCYDDSDILYKEVFETGENILKELEGIFGVQSNYDTKSKDYLFALNTMPWFRNEIISIDHRQAGIACGEGNLLKIATLEKINPPGVTLQEIENGTFVLQNDQLRITIQRGCIISLYDLIAKRDIIREEQKANQFVIFDDKPLYWQAWDVEVFHLDSRRVLLSEPSKIFQQNAHQVSIVTETKISDKSWAKTYIKLSAAVSGQQSYVEVQSEIEWREDKKFLKVEFPVNIRNTEASYETQYGIVRRPTHYNTSWDMAKFEVCCHKFADLSEYGYGVSILNDSKYGFATCGNLMRLSLIRAPKAPDAHADMGRHNIRWAILPHDGALGDTTVRTSFNFNNPLKIVQASTQTPPSAYQNPIRLTGNPSLILDVVKRGEDDKDVIRDDLVSRSGKSVILRIYESLGGTSKGVIETTLDVKKVWKTNLLEDDEERLSIRDGKVEICLRPFEVATYRLQL